jgi:hypothetical protein
VKYQKLTGTDPAGAQSGVAAAVAGAHSGG